MSAEPGNTITPIEIFCSYSHEDETLLKQLKRHLSVMIKEGLIELWHDGAIKIGNEWEPEIKSHLDSASIILLLVSDSFLASDYCYKNEMMPALERHKARKARVIPIILSPCDWENSKIGKLQVLPRGSKAITTWINPNQAFLDIVQGIREIVEELTIQNLIQQHPERISLFGYETDGGTKSALWKNPSVFSQKEKASYDAWWEMKRKITREEIVGKSWIRASNFGRHCVFRFSDSKNSDNGSFEESLLSDPKKSWEGTWALIDGILRRSTKEYEIHIFANRENSTYSGIEYKKGKELPSGYFVFLPFEESRRKHWDKDEVADLVNAIFTQVLNRAATASELIIFGSLLHRGEASVRDVVKLLGLSPDYRRQFIEGKTIDDAIEQCYQHFLARPSDSGGKTHYLNKVKKTGIDAIIVELIESPEYNSEFGENAVPSRHWLETNGSTIKIGLTFPKEDIVHESPIPAHGLVQGLPGNRRYSITGWVKTDIDYEQGTALIDPQGFWTIDRIALGAINHPHRIYFVIKDENGILVAKSEEIKIIRR